MAQPSAPSRRPERLSIVYNRDFPCGLSKEEAAAAPIADEYHFTFSEKVSHLTVTAETSEAIVPELRFEDDYTLVIAIPGGTAIGDGLGLKVSLTR